MRSIRQIGRLCVALFGLSIAATAPAQLIEVQESGSTVVATASGSFNTVNVTNYGLITNTSPSNLAGNIGVARIGTFSGQIDGYQLTSPFASFGTLSSQFATSTAGVGFGTTTLLVSGFGLPAGTPLFVLPTGYISGTSLFSTATWDNSSISSLGLTAGTYTALFNNQTVTLRIAPGVGAVPEPGTWALMLIGFGAIGATVRRRRSQLASAAQLASACRLASA